ncbi:hypothetical protein [Aquimarina sediminis]|uniref:hypothetical protein n=1 Tax=Aquimarina sediminis TaxID=2070536 RepID=UPI000CA04C8D|nr:hypothetical protein [Aquimarina sediminis]
MKYNKSYEGRTFEAYIEYLQTIKHKIPKALFDFISDPQRHDLGEKSLHDCRVEKIEYECVSKGNYQLSLILAGENRIFTVKCMNISQFHINQVNFGDLYKDLITYEVGVEQDTFKNDKIVFRAKFPFEKGVIEVFSEKMEIDEALQ